MKRKIVTVSISHDFYPEPYYGSLRSNVMLAFHRMDADGNVKAECYFQNSATKRARTDRLLAAISQVPA